MLKYLIPILILIIGIALSWAITMGLIYLICLCFSFQFNLLVSTGIWLIMILIKSLFPNKKGGTE